SASTLASSNIFRRLWPRGCRCSSSGRWRLSCLTPCIPDSRSPRARGLALGLGADLVFDGAARPYLVQTWMQLRMSVPFTPGSSSMRSIVLAVCVAISAAVCSTAGEQADAKAIVDKAIKAMGGETNLAKLKSFTSRSEGKFFGPDLDFSEENSSQ